MSSRAQPPEEARRKPVLGKLGTLLAGGRRRSSRSGSEGSASPGSPGPKGGGPDPGGPRGCHRTESAEAEPDDDDADADGPRGSHPLEAEPPSPTWGTRATWTGRPGGRRSGRRRRSQRAADTPPARDRPNAVFFADGDEGEGADGAVTLPSSGPSPPGAKPSPSPTKRKGRRGSAEAASTCPPAPPSPGPEPSRRKPDGPDDGKVTAVAAPATPRELPVKSSSLLGEVRPAPPWGPLPGPWAGRADGGRSRGEPDGHRARTHPPNLGPPRTTVTTKVSLPAKPKHVELNLKAPKSLDPAGNESTPGGPQTVHKGNTANKISLFENKRANNSPRQADTRGPKGTAPSGSAASKTFVGRAKLNLAKKSRESEQVDRKMSTHSGTPGSSAGAVREKDRPPELVNGEEPCEGLAPVDPGLAPASRADATLSAPVAAAEAPAPGDGVSPIPAAPEEKSEGSTDGKGLVEGSGSGSDWAPVPPGDPEGLSREPPLGTPNGRLSPSPPRAAAAPSETGRKEGPLLWTPREEEPAHSDQGSKEKGISCPGRVTLDSAGADMPVPYQNGGDTPLVGPVRGEEQSALSSGQDLAGEEGLKDQSPSKVLVQVRSYMLPVQSAQGLPTPVPTDGLTVSSPEGDGGRAQSPVLVVLGGAAGEGQNLEEPGLLATSPGAENHPPAQAQNDDCRAAEPTKPVPGDPVAGELAPTKWPEERDPAGAPLGLEAGPPSPLRSPGTHLNISAGSDDSILDSSSDMEKFTEIIKKIDSSGCVPQRKKKARAPNSPAPHFAMPPIHEDHLEKVFDPNVFSFGLGRKEGRQDMSPASQLLQNLDTKARLRPKRASTEESLILKALSSSSRLEPLAAPDSGGKDVTDSVKRSRLEKSALFSSMLTSTAPATSSLPPEKVFSPSVTSVSTITTSFGSSVLSRPRDPQGETSQPRASDGEPQQAPSTAPADVFNFDSSNKSRSGLTGLGHTEKHSPTAEEKGDLGSQSSLRFPETMLSDRLALKNGDDVERSGPFEGTFRPLLPSYGGSDPNFSGLFRAGRYEPSLSLTSMPLLETRAFKGNLQNKINPRPGKMVIYSEPSLGGEGIEVFGDIPDGSAWDLSPVIVIKVVRGCWIMYEKPNFEGNSFPLEEGEVELSDLWSMGEVLEENDESPVPTKPMVIGSLRHVIKDYRVSQIDLFTEPEGLGLMNSYFDDTEEMQAYGAMQKTCSIKVHWGVWLIYEEPGFQGIPFILEPGEYPDLSFWNTEEAYIGSMRPLKMGGRKVESLVDPKVMIYEKPFFEGKSLELDTELYNLGDDHSPLTMVGSIKVLGGIWGAYEKPGFTGHQYLLEEGEYREWKDWAGYDGELQSLRPLSADFSEAHMIMYSEKNFGPKGVNINVMGIIADLKETGYGLKTQSINVLSGVWVAYENPDFTGEQYILDKGLYASFEDWGGKNCKISSVQPISLDVLGNPKDRNKVQLFSEADFQGQSLTFDKTTDQIDDSFSMKSCRVLGGSWVAYDGENFSGNQFVLEEGHYPSLSAMGCPPGTGFRSLRSIDVEFSEPTIVLFEKEDFRGKKVELATETISLRSLGLSPFVRSVQVLGGIWVTYEFGTYRGRQVLLSPADIPNWYEFSGCRQIGSLRPFAQRRIYFRLRNKATGMFMSTNGNLEDLKLLRVQVMEDVGADDQIWVYQDGYVKCRIAEDCCLTIVGSLVTSGSKLGLALDRSQDSQGWSMKADGRIYSKLKPNLVLDVKGGTQYDQNHIILNTVNKDKSTQVWEALVL
ncbi:beta/gamma crystallin domain-containing protein 1 [Tachyglossus aculeatus]|uniref:beta/gamma crystallin domain-containing protein 1 n=1 Tax=Tachyglossus aculeatus TaxID=9261 RepID=UPI0018F718DC|nr:beta/gamma crystallin domain-containing protein 1 [Tachyglossus aculeatus]